MRKTILILALLAGQAQADTMYARNTNAELTWQNGRLQTVCTYELRGSMIYWWIEGKSTCPTYLTITNY